MSTGYTQTTVEACRHWNVMWECLHDLAPSHDALCRQRGAPHATWPPSCSKMAPPTPVQQICGRWAVCCMSALMGTLPLSAPPSTILSMTYSLGTHQLCQVSCNPPLGSLPASWGPKQGIPPLKLMPLICCKLIRGAAHSLLTSHLVS